MQLLFFPQRLPFLFLAFAPSTLPTRQVEATDAAIDKLVYELYGLTDEEIKIVEGEA